MKKNNIFFATDSSRLFLPWMSMLMTFIAVLFLAGGIISYKGITNWQRVVSGSLTVQIPTADITGESRGDIIQKDIETTLTILRSNPGVLGATVVSETQMNELMAPWLGDKAVLSELPVPKLIDVSIDMENYPDIAQLKTDLAVQVPSAVLDSHRMHLEPLLKIAGGIVKLIGFILILLAITASFTVIYSTRTGLSAHEHIISLTHMMGANDAFIIRQYASRNFKQTLSGGIFGFLLALPIMAGVSFLLHGASLETNFHSVIGWHEWSILFSVPVILSLLAFITTIKAVHDYLKRFL
jgi:cell division transport system permease protein